MIKLDKKLVDNYITLTKEYYKTGNTECLDERYKVKKLLEEDITWQTIDLLSNLAKYTQVSERTYNNNNIYNALAAFGVIVEELENDKKKY